MNIALSTSEAEALGRQLAALIALGHTARGTLPPRLLHDFSDRLNQAARAAAGRAPAQVSRGLGPAEGRSPAAARPSDQPATLTTREAGRLAGDVDPRTVRKWLARGEVQASRGHGGAWQVDIASLSAFISQRRKDHEHRAA